IYQIYYLYFLSANEYFCSIAKTQPRMYELSNEELLVWMRQGDEAAFEELYNRYWKKLYHAIYSRTRSTEWSEGIVQDFFTSLWLRRENLKVSSSFEAYAFTAVRYHLFHYIQKEVIRKKH